MLKSAKCGNCGHNLGLGPGIFGFKPAPRTLICPNCKASMKATFSYRFNYYRLYAWRIVILLSIVYFFIRFLPKGALGIFILFPVAVFIIGGICGMIASFFLAFPVMAIVDIIGASTGVSGDAGKSATPLYAGGMKSEDERLKKFIQQGTAKRDDKERV